MTTLSRTNLSTPQKAYCAANIVASQGQHGAVTNLCDTFEISKPTYYKIKETAEHILENYFSKQQENTTVEVTNSLLRRTIVALHIASPNSIRAIEDLLPIIYPRVKMSYGAIWNICHEAEINAALLNKMEDLSQIKNIALDELFSQGDPVLGGVDLDSGYVFSLALKERRGGEDWSNELL